MDPLEHCPEKMHIFQRPGRALEQCNEYSQIVFIDCFCLDSLDSFNWSRWVAITSLSPICRIHLWMVWPVKARYCGKWVHWIAVDYLLQVVRGKKKSSKCALWKMVPVSQLGSFFTMTSSCEWELSRNHLPTHANFVPLGSFPTFLDLGVRWIRDHGILFAGDV
jgi:hypothetical protein